MARVNFDPSRIQRSVGYQRQGVSRTRNGSAVPKVLMLFGLVAVYWFPIRRWFGRWGTTPDELTRAMAGDGLITNPNKWDMQAVTVNAPPEDIWPWLVQMGYQRGGLYSYDWLDRVFGFLDRPSARRILPEFQHLEVGDTISLGRVHLTVESLEPFRTLVLRSSEYGIDWVWEFGLYPLDEHRTRLVTRGIERFSNTPVAWLVMRLSEPTAFIMTVGMLMGVKARAEMLRAERGETVYARDHMVSVATP
jgi:hypothetical protein